MGLHKPRAAKNDGGMKQLIHPAALALLLAACAPDTPESVEERADNLAAALENRANEIAAEAENGVSATEAELNEEMAEFGNLADNQDGNAVAAR